MISSAGAKLVRHRDSIEWRTSSESALYLSTSGTEDCVCFANPRETKAHTTIDQQDRRGKGATLCAEIPQETRNAYIPSSHPPAVVCACRGTPQKT